MEKAVVEELLKKQQVWMDAVLNNQQKWLEQTLKETRKESAPSTISISPFRAFEKEKECFKDYVAQLEQYFCANNVALEDKKRSYFLAWVGTETYHNLNKIYGEKDFKNESYGDIIKSLSSYFKSSMHILAARCSFLQIKMKPRQSYCEWVADLRLAARGCEFKCSGNNCTESFTDFMIRDMIVLHTPHEAVRIACLNQTNPSLDEVIKIAHVFESTQQTVQIIKGDLENTCEVNQSYDNTGRSRPSNRNYNTQFTTGPSFRNNNARFRVNGLRSCPGCLTNHSRELCKFLHEDCRSCGKRGHIASVCLSRRNNMNGKRSPSRQRHSSNEYAQSLDVVSQSDVFDEVLQIEDSPVISVGRKMFISVKVNEIDLKFLLDTGATVSMIGLRGYQQLSEPLCVGTTTILNS